MDNNFWHRKDGDLDESQFYNDFETVEEELMSDDEMIVSYYIENNLKGLRKIIANNGYPSCENDEDYLQAGLMILKDPIERKELIKEHPDFNMIKSVVLSEMPKKKEKEKKPKYNNFVSTTTNTENKDIDLLISKNSHLTNIAILGLGGLMIYFAFIKK